MSRCSNLSVCGETSDAKHFKKKNVLDVPSTAKEAVPWSSEERKRYITSLHIVSLPGEEPILSFLSDAVGAAPLPAPWVMRRDPEGRVFFANQPAEVVSWFHPLEPSLRELAGAFRVVLTLSPSLRRNCVQSLRDTWEQEAKGEFAKWYSVKHSTGRAYYCHRDNGEAMWEHPAEVILPPHYLKLMSIEWLLNDEYFESLLSGRTTSNPSTARSAKRSPKRQTAVGGDAVQAVGEGTMLPSGAQQLPQGAGHPGKKAASGGAGGSTQAELDQVRRDLEQQLRQAVSARRALQEELSSAETQLRAARESDQGSRLRMLLAESELAQERLRTEQAKSECLQLSKTQVRAPGSLEEELRRVGLERERTAEVQAFSAAAEAKRRQERQADELRREEQEELELREEVLKEERLILAEERKRLAAKEMAMAKAAAKATREAAARAEAEIEESTRQLREMASKAEQELAEERSLVNAERERLQFGVEAGTGSAPDNQQQVRESAAAKLDAVEKVLRQREVAFAEQLSEAAKLQAALQKERADRVGLGGENAKLEARQKSLEEQLAEALASKAALEGELVKLRFSEAAVCVQGKRALPEKACEDHAAEDIAGDLAEEAVAPSMPEETLRRVCLCVPDEALEPERAPEQAPSTPSRSGSPTEMQACEHQAAAGRPSFFSESQAATPPKAEQRISMCAPDEAVAPECAPDALTPEKAVAVESVPDDLPEKAVALESAPEDLPEKAIALESVREPLPEKAVALMSAPDHFPEKAVALESAPDDLPEKAAQPEPEDPARTARTEAVRKARDVLKERAVFAEDEVTLERIRTQQAQRNCEKLASSRDQAVAGLKEAERAKAELLARLAAMEQELHEREECAESGEADEPEAAAGSESPSPSPSPSPSQSTSSAEPGAEVPTPEDDLRFCGVDVKARLGDIRRGDVQVAPGAPAAAEAAPEEVVAERSEEPLEPEKSEEANEAKEPEGQLEKLEEAEEVNEPKGPEETAMAEGAKEPEEPEKPEEAKEAEEPEEHEKPEGAKEAKESEEPEEPEEAEEAAEPEEPEQPEKPEEAMEQPEKPKEAEKAKEPEEPEQLEKPGEAKEQLESPGEAREQLEEPEEAKEPEEPEEPAEAEEQPEEPEDPEEAKEAGRAEEEAVEGAEKAAEEAEAQDSEEAEKVAPPEDMMPEDKAVDRQDAVREAEPECKALPLTADVLPEDKAVDRQDVAGEVEAVCQAALLAPEDGAAKHQADADVPADFAQSETTPERVRRELDSAASQREEVERMNTSLKERIAETEQALRRKIMEERTSAAALRLEEQRRLGERTREECNKLSESMLSALKSAEQACGECSEIEKRLAAAEMLLKERQAAATKESEQRKSALHQELDQERAHIVELEESRAGLDAKNRALEEQLREVAAMQAKLMEELRQKDVALVRQDLFSADVGGSRSERSPSASPRECPTVEEAPEDTVQPGPESRSAEVEGVVPRKARSHRSTPSARSARTPLRPGTADSAKGKTSAAHFEAVQAKVAALDRALREREDVHDAAAKPRKLHPGGAAEQPVSVSSSMTIKNVDYHRLSANPGLLSRFKQAMKQTIASSAGPGVLPEHVELALSAGSVVVVATITPPREVSAASVTSELKTAPLDETVALTVASLEGIREAATGPISVADLRVVTPEPSPRVRKASRTLGDARAQREKEARKARKAMEDAIVLASRIQLLRAEGARTRKRIQQAQEKSEALAASPNWKNIRASPSGYPAEQTARAQGFWRSAVGSSDGGAEAVARELFKAVGCEMSEILGDGVAESVELSFALAVRTKVAASKENMQRLNAALKAEVAQLKGQMRSALDKATSAAA